MFVFRNFTVENLFPEDAEFSGYDDISFLPENETRIVWLYQAPIDFDIKRKAQIIESYIKKLSFVISSLREGQQLYVCSLLDTFPYNIVDSDNSVKEAIEHFDKEAAVYAKSDPRINFIDISEYFSLFPEDEWINWKFYFISQMIISPKVASGFKEWFSHRLHQINGYRKKCLVLDLDNTLWGGVLGEDGIDGIKIGGDYPGNVFQYFQEAILSLAASGIILTVCSKNNEEDVKELWEKNPFVKIKDKELATWRINWNNKADNIREIAAELNIGLDSLVFLDDNPSERELVKRELPMVSVPEFPAQPYKLLPFIRSVVEKYFRTSNLTTEDLSKTEQYKSNARRVSSSKNFADLDEFIKSLEIEVNVFKADSFTIPRIAQMTQKTNQFNLTTRRYQESDLISFIDKGDWVVGASVKDKFGDSGITAAAIVKFNEGRALIDSFLMSCRILGKGIENVFLKVILNELLKAGVKEVSAEYIPTAKNAQVSNFYAKNGFETRPNNQDGRVVFSLTLDNPIILSDFYKVNYNL